MEIITDYIDLAIMHLPEIDILGMMIIALSIVILAALSIRYARRREKMKELKRQRKMLTTRLDELVGGRKKLRL
jgi:Flp pilus assembly protein TadB